MSTKPESSSSRTILGVLQRIAQVETPEHGQDTRKDVPMITKVTVKPNALMTAITLDVSCEQSQHAIVRLFSEEGKIVKMFSWYLIKGTNVTTIADIDSIHAGVFQLDIIDGDAELLYKTHIAK